MSILSDRQLKRLLPVLIPENMDYELVNPASIDIRVGLELKEEVSGGVWRTVPIGRYSKEQPYFFLPNQFILVGTLETINVPREYVVEFKMKSTRAREGYDHSQSFWIDPGWCGVVTMELKNVTTCTTLPVYPGLKMGQIVVHKLSSTPEKLYCGKYQGATTVQEAL